MMSSENGSQAYPSTGAASVAAGREKLNAIVRVQDLKTLPDVITCLSHNEDAQAYVLKRWRDPDTLILQCERSVLIASILEHDFFGGRVGVLVWAQNPDHVPVRPVLRVVEEWARDRGASRLISFMDENGPWEKLKAFRRLTGMVPFRMVFAKEL
jgi:hypothetical protein